MDALRCEGRTDPDGLDVAAPTFSWRLSSTERGQLQSAFQVLVASSMEHLDADHGDLWDSGKVQSQRTAHIPYEGRLLRSRDRAWWKVRAWDRAGVVSGWSRNGAFSLGLLDDSEWKARWVTDPGLESAPATRGLLRGYHCHPAASELATKWLVVDLGVELPVDAVRLHALRGFGWESEDGLDLFPKRFRVLGSTRADFGDARPLVSLEEEDQEVGGAFPRTYTFLPQPIRYVGLVVTKLPQRPAGDYAYGLSEFEVLSGGLNQAIGASVTAIDSFETGVWSSTNLVDGVLGPSPPLPAILFRKEFESRQPIRRATLRISGLGVVECQINGIRVPLGELAPEWTNYRRRVQAHTIDVTESIRSGANCVAAMVGEGWFAGRLLALENSEGRNAYGRLPCLKLQLEIFGADGDMQLITTDESWETRSDGPIVSAGIYDGETYDARKELSGWNLPGGGGVGWEKVRVADYSQTRLVWQRNEPIAPTMELAAQSVREPKPGVFVFDLGQNMVGRCRLRLHGAAGRAVVMKHGEALSADGTVYRANLGGAAQVDAYIPKDGSEATFEPRFTYHGFRYVEVSGLATAPAATDLRGIVIRSAATETGSFSCSDPLFNALARNIQWTQRGNMMGIPTDCPQRAERLGWLGDIQCFAQTACFNMDMAPFLTKWLQDVRDEQLPDGRYSDFAPHAGNVPDRWFGAPGWGDAGVLVPWGLYQNYGDLSVLRDHYDSACRWVDAIHRVNPEGLWQNMRGNDYADWMNGDTLIGPGWPATGAAVSPELFATAFWGKSASVLSKWAMELGYTGDAARYSALASRIRAAFVAAFVSPVTQAVVGDTQAGSALALAFDLLPEELRAREAGRLVTHLDKYGGQLSTGIQTTHRLLLQLSRWGYHEKAVRIVSGRGFPSWAMMIENGATTIWERWDGYVQGRGFQDPASNSLNHYALGSVGEWLWKCVVGLNPIEGFPGWSSFDVVPGVGGELTWAEGTYESIHGPIWIRWARTNGQFSLDVKVPPGSTARVHVPCVSPGEVLESGRHAVRSEHVEYLGIEHGRAIYLVASGDFHFRSTLPTGAYLAYQVTSGGIELSWMGADWKLQCSSRAGEIGFWQDVEADRDYRDIVDESSPMKWFRLVRR